MGTITQEERLYCQMTEKERECTLGSQSQWHCACGASLMAEEGWKSPSPSSLIKEMKSEELSF